VKNRIEIVRYKESSGWITGEARLFFKGVLKPIKMGDSPLFLGYTLENNKTKFGKTAIPTGTYTAFWRGKEKLQLRNVKNYEAIQVHVGNNVSDSDGCILLGLARGGTEKDPTVLSSRNAISALYEYTHIVFDDPDQITIVVKDSKKKILFNWVWLLPLAYYLYNSLVFSRGSMPRPFSSKL